METKIKHLEMIQAVISRMAANSFAVKGWSLTISAALIGFAIQTKNASIGYAAVGPILLFWWLDSYYLHQERLFRRLYESVRTEAEPADFSMDTKPVDGFYPSIIEPMTSSTILVFHLAILAAVVATINCVIKL